MAQFGFDTHSSPIGNLIGLRLDPYQVFKFVIAIEGIFAGGFSECSGLQVETEFQEYREGGVNEYIHHFVGAAKHPPLMLKHGLTQIDGLWRWHQEVVQSVSFGEGKITRRNGTIFLLDKKGVPVMWWDFTEAVPVKWTGPELRADSSSVAFESIQLVHRGLSRPKLANILAGAAAELAAGFDLPFGL